MGKLVVFQITEVSIAPYYVEHNYVRRINEGSPDGKRMMVELEVFGTDLDTGKHDGYNIALSSSQADRLKHLGISSPSALIGHRVVLEISEEADVSNMKMALTKLVRVE